MPEFAQLPIDKITVHPRNIRRDAAIDDEMVESIRAAGLVTAITVAPKDDGWVLIGGHRRLVNAREAGLTVLPAMIRSDLVTDAQHIEAMAIENIQRQDLTAVEEADAYEQLQLIGYTQERIASTTGRSVGTVASRLKLAHLPEKARDAVHAGGMTLSEAADLAELDDDPEIRDGLLEHIGTSDWSWRLRSAHAERDRRRKLDAAHQKLTAGTAKVATKKQVENHYNLDTDYKVYADGGGKITAKNHANCPGHRVYVDPYSATIRFLCTDHEKYGHVSQYEWERSQRGEGADGPAAKLLPGLQAADDARRSFAIATIRDHAGGAPQAITTILHAIVAPRGWNSPWKAEDHHVVEAAIHLGHVDPDDPDAVLADVINKLEETDALQVWVLAIVLNVLRYLNPHGDQWPRLWASEHCQLAIDWLDSNGYQWTDDEAAALEHIRTLAAEEAA